MRLYAVLAVLLCISAPTTQAEPGVDPKANVKCAFGQHCDELLISAINNAQKDISVAIYSFTHRKIAEALVQAKSRGVKISFKYDKEQADWEGMQAALKILRKGGIHCEAITTTQRHSAMHHKFCVIDGVKTLTGSFNYSFAAATRNYENIILIESKAIAAAHLKEFSSVKDK